MHVVNWTIAGLLVLALFILAARLINRRRSAKAVDGALFFVGVWFFASVFNFYNGWANHGIPLLNEVAAFVPIFGIPAAAAWYWSHRIAGGKSA